MNLNKFVNLKTEYADTFDKTKPLPEYPRPNLRRENYLNLNGEWDYVICKDNGLKPTKYEGKIVVPYPLESELSGVKRTLKRNEVLYYHLSFNIEKEFIKDIVFLNIDACDQLTEVYFNDVFVGSSKNGYLPIKCDVTPFIHSGKNKIVVKVKDNLSHRYPYGKQRKNRGGMWYTPCSGIWKTVWMESVPEDYIKNIEITPLDVINGVHIHLDTDAAVKRIMVFNNKEMLKKYEITENDIDITFDHPMLWSVDAPFLYDLHIETENDDVYSYFALRKIELINGKIHLNGKEIFCNGVLDQGYFPDGLFTPASYKAYAYDILHMKNLGFNTLRKHIKIEPLYFYYLCDCYGMLVFQDMVNNGHYSFMHDTALPTVFKGLKIKDNILHKKDNKVFTNSMIETVNYLKFFPSIILWTIYNEGWGQYKADDMHKLLMLYDNTRLIDDTSGWFSQKENMFNSKHVYFKKVSFDNEKDNKPILLSEFGGYSYRIKDHIFNPHNEYGYKKYKDQKEFEQGIIDLYENEIIPNKDKMVGCIYTQLSDVEDETNGLVTYDRKVIKVDIKRISELMKKLNSNE